MLRRNSPESGTTGINAERLMQVQTGVQTGCELYEKKTIRQIELLVGIGGPRLTSFDQRVNGWHGRQKSISAIVADFPYSLFFLDGSCKWVDVWIDYLGWVGERCGTPWLASASFIS